VSTAVTSRSFAVDALKGMAIACVVLGHAILRNVADPSTNWAYLFLTAFEMPLFMFLSGYVLPGRVRGSRVAWVRKRVVRLMIPFFAWHAIFFLSLRLTAIGKQPPAELAGGLLRYLATTFASPTAGLWYLPSLLLCSIALAILFPLRKKPLLLVFVGWLAFDLLLRARGMANIVGDYGLIKTSTYWLLFSAGYAWAEWGRSLQPGSWFKTLVPVLIYPLAAVPVMRAMPALGAFGGEVTKVTLGLAGTWFSSAFLHLAEPVARWLRLDRLGRLTLGVYCSQWLFLRVEFAQGAVGVLAAFAFTLTGSAALTWLIGRIPGLKGVLLGEWKTPVRVGGESLS